MSQESDSPLPRPPAEPTRELLLAQALDACIRAERRVPGSSERVIARQPAWAHDDLRRLVELAGSLDAVATDAIMSEEFRDAARARLMERIGGTSLITRGAWVSTVPSRNGYHTIGPRRSKRWLWRGSGGALFAAVLIGAASLTASANALPGEPLYSVKQAREELGLRLAMDDQARAVALLQQADSRLQETARLLQEGRTQEVAQTTQRFDDVLQSATTTLAVTIADSQSQAADPAVESALTSQEQQIESMLVSAPESARSDLREALAVAERSRELVSDRRAAEQAAETPALAENPELAENSSKAADRSSVAENAAGGGETASVAAPVAPPAADARAAPHAAESAHAAAVKPTVEVRTLNVRIDAPKTELAEKPAAPPDRQERRGAAAAVRAESQPAPAANEEANNDGPTLGDVPPPNVPPAVDSSQPQRALAAPVDEDRVPAPTEPAIETKPRAPEQPSVANPPPVQSNPETAVPGNDNRAGDAHQSTAPSQTSGARTTTSGSASDDHGSATNSAGGGGDSGGRGHGDNTSSAIGGGSNNGGTSSSGSSSGSRGSDHKGD